MSNRLLFDNSGFTLIEVIVAMALTTLLTGFAFGIYLFGEKYFVRWQEKMRAEDQAHVAAQAISNALFHADKVLLITPHSITIESRSGEKRRFWLDHHHIMADSINMMNKSLPVLDFRCQSDADSLTSDRFIAKQSAKIVDFITFELSIIIQKDTLTLERSVYLRKQSHWDPLLN